MPPSHAAARVPLLARLEWILPAALAADFLAVGLRATPFVHGPIVLAGLVLLYVLLALCLHLGARFAVRAGPLYGVPACLGIALAAATQLRVDAEKLERPLVLAAFVLGVAALYFFALRACLPRESFASPRALARAYAALVGLIGATFVAARASDELRWHLLAHQRLLGTPLYWLDAPPLASARDELWSRRAHLVQPLEQAVPVDPPRLTGHAPHVVFLLLDTLRADALEPLGGAANVMPEMSALAGRSTLFTNLRANASWTRASCASIFTGLLPEEHGAARFHEKLDEHWQTLPELMQAAGYQTAAFVANWVQVGRETGFAQGFAEADFHELNSGDEILAQAGAGAGENEVRGGYARAETLDRAVLDWVASDARERAKPLFLYLHYLDPHSPYLEPPEPGTLSADAHERKRGLYRQELRYLDRQLARFLAELDRVLEGPKLIVFTSDHGEEFYEHGDWGHGHTLYEELLWVPLFVHVPEELGGHAGRVDAALESRDLFTLVPDLVRDPGRDLGAWGTAHARGTRYASQYLDRVEDARADKKWTGLRRVEADGWALIWSAFGPSWQLYDETNDPHELDNRADRERARFRALRAELERAVGFWTAPATVQRTPRELDFLRKLGYVGGVEEPQRAVE